MYVLWIAVCPFVLLLLAIVLSVPHRYTDSDYHFGIFKLFLLYIRKLLCDRSHNGHMHTNTTYVIGLSIEHVNVKDKTFTSSDYLPLVRLSFSYYFVFQVGEDLKVSRNVCLTPLSTIFQLNRGGQFY